MPIDAATTVANLEAVGCTRRQDDTGVDRDARRPGAPTSPTPTTWSRRSPGSSATTEVPSVLPTRPAGRGLTREQRLRRRVGRTLAGAGCVEVVSFPFVGDADLRRARPARRRPAPAHGPARQPALARGAGATPRRCCPACSRRPPATSAAARPASRCSRPAPSPSPPTAARRRSYGVDWRPDRRRARRSCSRRSPTSRSTSRVVLAGERERAGWWGAGREAGWADAIGLVRRLGARARRRGRGRGRRPGCRGTPAAARALRVGGRALGHAGELHPRSARRSALPPRSAAVEIDLDAAAAAAPSTSCPAPAFSTYPVAKEDVALVVDESVPAAEVEAALREGAGELLESVRLFDVYTGDQVGRGQEVAGLRAAVPRPRPDPHRGGDQRRPRRRGGAGRRAHRRRPALTDRRLPGSRSRRRHLARPAGPGRAHTRAAAQPRRCGPARVERDRAWSTRSGATTSRPTRRRRCRSWSPAPGLRPAARRSSAPHAATGSRSRPRTSMRGRCGPRVCGSRPPGSTPPRCLFWSARARTTRWSTALVRASCGRARSPGCAGALRAATAWISPTGSAIDPSPTLQALHAELLARDRPVRAGLRVRRDRPDRPRRRRRRALRGD